MEAQCRIFLKSCENMCELKDKNIDIVVTSPPYWNAIDYDRYVENPMNYKTRKGPEYKDFLLFLERCFRECYRVLKDGKFCCVVIGSLFYQGRNYPLAHDFVVMMRKIGFDVHQELIWHKALRRMNRFDESVKWIQPGRYYPNFMFEYIFIFRKPGTPIYKNRTSEEIEENSIPIDKFFRDEIAKDVWTILPVHHQAFDHPCPFPEEIPYRLINLYSFKGNLVLDPFLGAGTTAAVALACNRRFYGYEVKKEFIEVTKRRLKKPVYLQNQLVSHFEKHPKQRISQGFLGEIK